MYGALFGHSTETLRHTQTSLTWVADAWREHGQEDWWPAGPDIVFKDNGGRRERRGEDRGEVERGGKQKRIAGRWVHVCVSGA